VLNSEVSRELDPSEVYYELIDRTWAMNAMTAAELDVPLTTAQVEEAWNRLAEHVPVIGSRIDRRSGQEASMVFGTAREPLPITRYDDDATAWAQESRVPFDAASGPLVRCALVEKESAASVLFVSHHSVLDGRGLVELALLFCAVLLDDGDVADHALAEPTVSLHVGDGARSAGRNRLADAVALARRMRDEDGFVGAAETVSWHDPRIDAPRDVGFGFFDLSEVETSGLLAWARSQQSTVHGAISAAALRAAADLSPGSGRLGIAASVDLRSRFETPDHGFIGLAAGVISASYDTTVSTGELAREISTDVRRRFDRGEGELLYTLSGAGRFPVDHTADRVIKGWTEQATPTVFIGNLGAVPESAPHGLRRLRPGLAPLPNQSAYVAGATYGGRLSLTVGLDRNRLSIDPDTFVSTVRARLLELASIAQQSGALR
jgi:hypothetical protein